MKPRSAVLVALLFLAISLAIAACGSGGGPTSPAPGGGTGPAFDLGFSATGVSQAFVFADTGSWGYQCSPHGSCCGMTGVVIVTSTATAESALVSVGPSNQLRFSPDTVRIKPGHSVRWVNVSSSTIHTVTRP